MRKRYIQDPVTLELIPAEQYRGPSTSKSAYVVPDIQPYQSMVNGEMITSRSQHREHLKKHNCFEIGNEISAAMERPKPKADREALRRTIADVLTSKGF